MKRIFLFVLVSMFVVAVGRARGQAPATVPAEPGSSIRVFLMTIGPGAEVYELFGHNAIVVSDASSGFEAAYNWGVFDFNQPNFVGRFILGRMLYRMEAMDLAGMVGEYRRNGRESRLVELNLSPGQKRRLLQLLMANDTDANREYRYDYYRDNCSTRVRDMLNSATGNQIAEQLKGRKTEPPRTFRFHTDRLAQRVPWLYAGLKYVLGAEVDRELTKWDESFLPLELERHLGRNGGSGGGGGGEGVTVVWEDGSVHPILGREIAVSPATLAAYATEPPDWRVWFLTAGVLYGGVLVGLSRVGRGGRWGGRLVGLVGMPWGVLCVVMGGISTFGWVATDHTVARGNVNWLQLSPLSVPIVCVMVLLVVGRRPKWGVIAAAVPLMLSVLGLVLKLVVSQPNAPILLFALPVHAGLFLAVLLLIRRPSPIDV